MHTGQGRLAGYTAKFMELENILGRWVGKGLVGQKTRVVHFSPKALPSSAPLALLTHWNLNRLFSAYFLNQRAQWGLKLLILSLCPPGMRPWACPRISSSSWPAAGTWPSAQLSVRVPCGPGPSSYHTGPTTQRAAPWVTPPSWHIPHWKTWSRVTSACCFLRRSRTCRGWRTGCSSMWPECGTSSSWPDWASTTTGCRWRRR